MRDLRRAARCFVFTGALPAALCRNWGFRAAAEAEEREQREKMTAMTPAQRRIYLEQLEQERKEAEWNSRE